MNWSGLRLSVTLLTVIPWRGPAGRSADATAAGPAAPVPPLPRATAGSAMAWAPAVGLLLGVIAAAVLVTADHPLGAGPLTASVLAVIALAAATRGLHLDGLADLADGLGSGKPRAAALDIMRRSDIGPFGTVTLVLNLLLQVAALAHAEAGGDGRGPAAVITAAVTGRLALTWTCRRGVGAARPEGLGVLVAGTVRPVIPAAITVVLLAATAGAVAVSAAVTGGPLGWSLPLAVAAGLLAGFAVERRAVRRLGGITGDVLGAIIEIAATVTLVVAAMGPRALSAEIRPGGVRFRPKQMLRLRKIGADPRPSAICALPRSDDHRRAQHPRKRQGTRAASGILAGPAERSAHTGSHHRRPAKAADSALIYLLWLFWSGLGAVGGTEPDDQFGRDPTAILDLNALRLGPLADFRRVDPARRSPAAGSHRTTCRPRAAPRGVNVLGQSLPQRVSVLCVQVDLVLSTI
jgi:adenosylcobinamide-GDP ribazoletransferase